MWDMHSKNRKYLWFLCSNVGLNSQNWESFPNEQFGMDTSSSSTLFEILKIFIFSTKLSCNSRTVGLNSRLFDCHFPLGRFFVLDKVPILKFDLLIKLIFFFLSFYLWSHFDTIIFFIIIFKNQIGWLLSKIQGKESAWFSLNIFLVLD